jgi:signal transduction histidine kinase
MVIDKLFLNSSVEPFHMGIHLGSLGKVCHGFCQSVLAIQNARLFREIEDKSRQIEAANRHKSEFLANMSHELRTPVNAIIRFSEVLGARLFGELNEKQAEYTEDILSSRRHLLSLNNEILDLSKIRSTEAIAVEHSTELINSGPRASKWTRSTCTRKRKSSEHFPERSGRGGAMLALRCSGIEKRRDRLIPMFCFGVL